MEEKESPRKKSTTLSDFAEILETVLISIFVVIMLFGYVIRPVTVEGHSMESTLHDGDRLLMTDLLYTPARGDIVIVDNDHAYLMDAAGNITEESGLPDEKRLIKRIIALPGDELDIDFKTGVVTLNGERLNEDYINNATTIDEGAFEYPITIPDGYYFVMGDNRQNSTDSRSFYIGLIPEDAILGKAIYRISTSDFGSIY